MAANSRIHLNNSLNTQSICYVRAIDLETFLDGGRKFKYLDHITSGLHWSVCHSLRLHKRSFSNWPLLSNLTFSTLVSYNFGNFRNFNFFFDISKIFEGILDNTWGFIQKTRTTVQNSADRKGATIEWHRFSFFLPITVLFMPLSSNFA